MTTDPDDVVFFLGSKVGVTDRTARGHSLLRPVLPAHSLPLTAVTGRPTLPSLLFKTNESTRVSLISVDCRTDGRAMEKGR